MIITIQKPEHDIGALILSSNDKVLDDVIKENRKFLRNYSNSNETGNVIHVYHIALFEMMEWLTKTLAWYEPVQFRIKESQNEQKTEIS